LNLELPADDMKILAIALADDSRRYNRGYPPKGAQMFLNPDLEIAALMRLAAGDQFTYQDEKAETLNLEAPCDLALISTDLWQESRIREVVQELRAQGRPVVLFGPLATAKPEEFITGESPKSEVRSPDVRSSVVVGCIFNAWAEVRGDAEAGRLKPVYNAPRAPVYVAPDMERTLKPAFDPSFQCLRAIVGCRCPSPVKPYCRQHMYYGGALMKRNLPEVASEIADFRRKHIALFDDDVAQDRDYYRDLLSRVWRCHHEWTVLAGAGLFDDPAYVRVLAKAGVRVVHLNESWLSVERLLEARQSRRLFRDLSNQIALLHRNRLLVGARVSLFLTPGESFDYEGTYRVLKTLGLDFLLARTFSRRTTADEQRTTDDGLWPGEFEPAFVSYQPGLLADRPTWWKNQFYDFNTIFVRSARRPARIGFYSTLFYYFPRSFAYRQNFLEGIAYPP
jgi:hypothetical protein